MFIRPMQGESPFPSILSPLFISLLSFHFIPPLPALLRRKAARLIQVEGLGNAEGSAAGPDGARSTNNFLVNLEHKILDLRTT